MEPTSLVLSVLGHEKGTCEHLGAVMGGMSGATLEKYSIKKEHKAFIDNKQLMEEMHEHRMKDVAY